MSSALRHRANWRAGTRKQAPRRLRVALVGALLALVLAAALSIPGPGGTNLASAAIQRAKSLVELMHQRSPGKRLVAHLANTKHKKLVLHERALPKIRKQAPAMAALPAFPAELPPALIDLVAPPIPMEMASLEALPVGPFQVPGGPPGFFLPPPGGFILPPTQTPTPPIVTPPVIIPQAVPEPGTWAMILLGFGVIGWSLRRSPYREQTAA